MDVATALGTYLDIVDSVAPGLVEGLYVVGSYALGDWTEGTSDIDIVAVTAEPATDDDFGSLRTVHALLAEQPLPFIDGPYLAWGDLLIEPATGLHRPWVLDGRLRHDGECFEINPITWYTLATYGVTVRGPAVESLGIPIDIEARIRFVVDNLQGYWRGVADGVAAACARAEKPAFSAADLASTASQRRRRRSTRCCARRSPHERRASSAPPPPSRCASLRRSPSGASPRWQPLAEEAPCRPRQVDPPAR